MRHLREHLVLLAVLCATSASCTSSSPAPVPKGPAGANDSGAVPDPNTDTGPAGLGNGSGSHALPGASPSSASTFGSGQPANTSGATGLGKPGSTPGVVGSLGSGAPNGKIGAVPGTLSTAGSTATSNAAINSPDQVWGAVNNTAGAAAVGSWNGKSDVMPPSSLWSLITKASCIYLGTTCGSQPAAASSGSPGKKGAGLVHSSGADAGTKLGIKWSYNWTAKAYAGAAGPVEFVPMVKDRSSLDDANLQGIKNSGAKVMLGFNEPDHTDQASMPVDEAIAAWPKLTALNIRLGSPAPASAPDWIDDFMKKANALNYRVDFIAVHRYPDFGNDGEVDKVKAWLVDLHTRYNKPIWLTEFGVCNWGTADSVSMDKITANMTKMINMLESLDFLERYAWFTDAPFNSCDRSTLLDGSGNPSAVGAAYKAAGAQ